MDMSFEPEPGSNMDAAAIEKGKAAAVAGPHGLAGYAVVAALKHASPAGAEHMPSGDSVRRLMVAAAVKLQSGDLSGIEGMLSTQAITLNALANVMFMEAAHWKTSSDNYERLMRLALKAQSQSARTAEILLNAKLGPRLAIVGQLNSATTQQVVNHAPPSQSPVQQEVCSAGNEKSSAPAISETSSHFQHATPLDTIRQRGREQSHSQLAAVGKINGTKNGRRKGEVQPQRMEGRETGCHERNEPPSAVPEVRGVESAMPPEQPPQQPPVRRTEFIDLTKG